MLEDLILAAGRLRNADEFEEAYEAFKEAADALEYLTLDKLRSIAKQRLGDVRANIHDAKVQAQGGI